MELPRQSQLQRSSQHVWGNYLQYIINESLLVRSIRIRVGAMTSLHSHASAELLIVESGAVRVWLGATANAVEATLLTEGSTLFVRGGELHRVEGVEGVEGILTAEGGPCAQLVEVMFGDNQQGNYPIEKYDPARGPLRPPFPRRVP